MPASTRLLARQPAQPDSRSCGAAVCVMAEALRDETYAEFLLAGVHPRLASVGGLPADRFAAETLAMHARITGPVDLAGRLQMPWPRSLGTPPWAVASQLSVRGPRYTARAIRVSPESARPAVIEAVDADRPVPLFVGTRLLPRHVILAFDRDGDDLVCYDPAGGRTVPVTAAQFASGPIGAGRWARPWFAVLPSRRKT